MMRHCQLSFIIIIYGLFCFGLFGCYSHVLAQKSAEDGIEIKKASKNSLITIKEDNWEQLLSGEWMVELYVI